MLISSKKQLSVLLAVMAITIASALHAEPALLIFVAAFSSFTVAYHFALKPQPAIK